MIRTGLLHVPALDMAASEAVRALLRGLGAAVVMQEKYAASQRHWIEETLRQWCDEEELDLILTIGGTLPAPGPSSAEIVPEATLASVERLLPGLPEAMRAYAQDEVPLAILDRSMAGIRGRTLILNLPAGAAPATLFFEAVVEVLPIVLAHLRQEASAPTLADVMGGIEVVELDEVEEVAMLPDKPANPAPPPSQEPSKGKGLNAADFAEFLRRSQGKGSDRG